MAHVGPGATCRDHGAIHSLLSPADETCPVFVGFMWPRPQLVWLYSVGLSFAYREWFSSSAWFEAVGPLPLALCWADWEHWGLNP